MRFKPPGGEASGMIPLQETVNAGVIQIAGLVVGLGGIALTALWLRGLWR